MKLCLRTLVVPVVTAWVSAINGVAAPAAAPAGRPNVLLMMADDLGYADLGCYGGEIETPHLDGLAGAGVRFSHFRVTPMCTTSRVALMAGMPLMRSGGGDYKHSAPLPAVLRRAGYRTMMVGKWHAGKPDPRSRRLFDRAFGFLGGMSDCFVGGDDWFLDAEQYRDFSPDFYATDAFADYGVRFMREALEQDQPFFLYVAFNAPHHPCQAPRATVEKYRGRYRRGYEWFRQRRFERQQELRLVGADLTPSEPGTEARRWDELPRKRQRIEANRMAAYAAAVDEVDQSVGRLLRFLDESDISDETLVLFLSDNGGDYNNGSLHGDARQVPWKPRNNPSSSNGWASVKNTPFRSYKHSCYEGALAAPLIVRWPNGADLQAGSIVHETCSITDLYPTLLDVAGADYPEEFDGHPVRPLVGASLTPLLAANGERSTPPAFFRYNYSRAWVEDEWKAVSLYGGPWQLFNLTKDRGERVDLASANPLKLANRVKKWERFARESGAPTQPTGDRQHEWGWHRKLMVCPALTDLRNDFEAVDGGVRVTLRLELDKAIDFRETRGKKIRLFAVSDEDTPVWQADPDQSHPAQGRKAIVFDDVPLLKPDRQYYVLWEPGWVRVGGQPVRSLNDGAYWWRFRTPPAGR
ncbi:MAG: sulfatase-like hydrolase/transferase [Planctomycetota bacterium]